MEENIYLRRYILPWINSDNIQLMNKYLLSGKYKKFEKGFNFSPQGEINRQVVYLTEGMVKVSTITPDGQEKTFWYNEAPCIIGEVPFFHMCESNASIIACTNCVGYIYSKERFLSIIHQDMVLYDDISKNMANKIRVLCNQIEELTFIHPMQKVCRFIYFFAQKYGVQDEGFVNIYLDIGQKEIASINSLHRVTVTKILNDLKNRNILSNNNKGEIIIYDMGKLKEKCFED